MKWLLIIQIMGTNQHVALNAPDEAACRADLDLVRAGVYRTLTMDNGVVLPVAKGIECVSEAEFLARKGSGA